MLALPDIEQAVLTCVVIFWAKQQLMMHFNQNLSLNFLSFLDIYLNGSGSSGDNNQWYCISSSYWVDKACINSNHLNFIFCDKRYFSFKNSQQWSFPSLSKGC